MIKHNDITIGISGAELESLKQEQINEFQDKRITWQGEENVLVTTVLQRIYEFAAGKVQIVLADTLPQTTEPNTQYWVKTYDGSTLEDGRFIIMTDYLNSPTYIGTSSVDLAEYYTKTETDNLLDQKQDTLGNDTAYSTPSDSDNLSDVNLSTKKVKRITFAKIWDWIVTKLTANTEKGIQVSGGKLGHSNSITPPSTGASFYNGVLDEQGHYKGTPSAFTHSDVYSSSTENQLFTRKGANDLYNWAKITDASGANAVLTTGMNSYLTRTAHSHASTVSRVMKYCGVVSLQYFGQYKATGTISNNFTCIGSVPDGYKPASNVAIQVTTWNLSPAACSSGYITTDGKIYAWVTTANSGTTNIQFVINATWKAAS